jgi:hypothetical protein
LRRASDILAIFVGGIWTAWTFFAQRTDIENVTVGLTAESVEYGRDRLLIVHIKPKNIGKVLIKLATFRLTVRKIPPGLQKEKPIELLKIEPMASVDLMRHDPDGYEIEPGVDYDDVELFIVPKNTIVDIQVVLELKAGYIPAHAVHAVK